MNYIPQILWLLAWPIIIIISYKLSVLALKFWEKKQGKEQSKVA